MMRPEHNDNMQQIDTSEDDQTIMDAALLHESLHPDPFAVLGRRVRGESGIIRAFSSCRAYRSV